MHARHLPSLKRLDLCKLWNALAEDPSDAGQNSGPVCWGHTLPHLRVCSIPSYHQLIIPWAWVQEQVSLTERVLSASNSFFDVFVGSSVDLGHHLACSRISDSAQLLIMISPPGPQSTKREGRDSIL